MFLQMNVPYKFHVVDYTIATLYIIINRPLALGASTDTIGAECHTFAYHISLLNEENYLTYLIPADTYSDSST